GHEDPGTGRPELRTRRALDVLLIHRESGPTLGLDLVLRADPKIRRIDDRAIERVVAARGWYVGFMQADLLWPDPDAQGIASGIGARRPDHRLIGESQPDISVVVAFDGPGQQVADPEEPGDEARGWTLIQHLGFAELLVPSPIHH